MKYQLERSNNFKRSFKKKKLNDEEELAYIDVIFKLLNGIELEEKYKDHQLKGNLKEFRECHIKPDLLLTYKIIDDTLILADIGSHSEIFKK
ncbi:MAG: Toxin-antitoxin system, toxin component, RelE family [uncultured Sulfurovum sp.]|uniref:Toxin-antitoxin system, toxin component, RelE family n=1 Tax=uncultured Sulfurovum sp. TaxID=269237 RepID=A0A6S6SVY5_9BACT|nr:MAG: Toxin-antitoxin system, toxin component, RelE family [uncultured Sulfurovum sp.]